MGVGEVVGLWVADLARAEGHNAAAGADTPQVGEQVLAFSMVVLELLAEVCLLFSSSFFPEEVELQMSQGWN